MELLKINEYEPRKSLISINQSILCSSLFISIVFAFYFLHVDVIQGLHHHFRCCNLLLGKFSNPFDSFLVGVFKFAGKKRRRSVVGGGYFPRSFLRIATDIPQKIQHQLALVFLSQKNRENNDTLKCVEDVSKFPAKIINYILKLNELGY